MRTLGYTAAMQRSDWNARYDAKDLVWGTEPNCFVADALAALPAGTALELACGEGRNSLWLAGRGWRVTAVDFSDVAIERARRLAQESGHKVDFEVADVTRYAPAPAGYDLVVITYLQVPGDDRARAFACAVSALAPGGTLFAVGHARRNLAEGYGGPSDAGVLWEPAEVRAQLEAASLAVQLCEHVDRPVETDDGPRTAIDMLVRAQRVR